MQGNALAAILNALEPPDRPLVPLRPSFLDPTLWRTKGRKTASKGVNWPALRDEVLARDEGCVYCRYRPAPGSKQPLEVNHLNGWEDNRLTSLAATCCLCHRVFHAGRSSAVFGSLLL